MIRDAIIRILGGVPRTEVETRDRTIARLHGAVISLSRRITASDSDTDTLVPGDHRTHDLTAGGGMPAGPGSQKRRARLLGPVPFERRAE